MKKLTIRNKLFVGFLLIATAVVVSNLITITTSQRILTHYERSRRTLHIKSEPLLMLQNKLLRAAMPVNDFLINNLERENKEFRQFEVAIEKDFAAVSKSAIDPSVARLIGEAHTKWRAAKRRADHLLITGASLESNGYSEMKMFDEEIFDSATILQTAHARLEVVMASDLERAREHRRQAYVVAGVFFIVLILVAMATSIWLARSIIRPIEIFRTESRRVGHGHLDQRISLHTNDEFELLANDFNWMAERLQKSREDLHELSVKDEMTDLYNHRELLRLLSREIQYAHRTNEPLSLMMIDIDCLKQVNDVRGHLAGDETLRAVARVIDGEMREGDWAARYGGDEFCVILPGTDLAGGAAIAQRIKDSVARDQIISENRHLGRGVSIGCAELHHHCGNETDIIHAADQALYVAKRSGKNCVSSSTVPQNITAASEQRLNTGEPRSGKS